MMLRLLQKSYGMRPLLSRALYSSVSLGDKLEGMQVDSTSASFLENKGKMSGLIEELQARSAQVALGGGPVAISKHKARGKLLARERIDQLLDVGTSFLELSQFAGWDLYPTKTGMSPTS
ncbi:MAG: hypothetical protein Q8P67_01325 [archaeon]|nr:hypothetical protein [archaeon]